MVEILSLVTLVAFSVFPVYVYIATDFVPWVLRGRSKRVDEYWEYRTETNPRITLPEYVFQKNPTLLTKLQSCPTCLLFWSSVISTFHLTVTLVPLVWLLSIITYKIVWKIERI